MVLKAMLFFFLTAIAGFFLAVEFSWKVFGTIAYFATAVAAILVVWESRMTLSKVLNGRNE